MKVYHDLIDEILLIDNPKYSFKIPVPNRWQRFWWRILLGAKCKIKKA